MSNHVVTYYVPVEGLWSDESQRKLIEVWRRSWEKAGWTATVLTESDCKTHPRYGFFREHFFAKPSEYPIDYTAACFMRWLAAAHFGALRSDVVMLTDYDVINYGFEPRPPEHGKMEILCDEPPVSIFMGAVLGTPQHFLDMAELFAAWKPDDLDFNHNAGLLHQDDLSMLVRMFETKTRPKPDWFIKSPGCTLYDYGGYRTAKMVHFGYAMKQRGFWPKHEWIEKIRRF